MNTEKRNLEKVFQLGAEVQLINASQEDLELLKEVGLKLNENTYIVKQGEETCGVIEYKVLKGNSIKIEYINILERFRRNGLGRKVIQFLQTNFEDYEIYRDSTPTQIATSFWESVGAELEYEMEIEEYAQNLECIPFIIH